MYNVNAKSNPRRPIDDKLRKYVSPMFRKALSGNRSVSLVTYLANTVIRTHVATIFKFVLETSSEQETALSYRGMLIGWLPKKIEILQDYQSRREDL